MADCSPGATGASLQLRVRKRTFTLEPGIISTLIFQIIKSPSEIKTRPRSENAGSFHARVAFPLSTL